MEKCNKNYIIIEKNRYETYTYGDLIDKIIDLGKKGLSINRYKGLGEMNPEQLWETTLNTEKRSLLLVNIEEASEADLLFSTLMGDEVEGRKIFIQENELSSKFFIKKSF